MVSAEQCTITGVQSTAQYRPGIKTDLSLFWVSLTELPQPQHAGNISPVTTISNIVAKLSPSSTQLNFNSN